MALLVAAVGCSAASPTEVDHTPVIEATVETRVLSTSEAAVAIEATAGHVEPTASAPATTAPQLTLFGTPTIVARLPELDHFATNKSDRFLVDFEDIIAGHPYVGQRSPVPHNDAQVYFSNSDPRWINATQPSDYPPVYAVADGIIRTSHGTSFYYNLRDKTFHDPPWWHVKYDFNLEIATEGETSILFMYSLEPQILFDGSSMSSKPKDFYKDFILVEDGQRVNKGDILAYLYVPPLEERVTPTSSTHISFSLKRDPGGPWDMYAPAIFTEGIVSKFSQLYRNPSEGWDSPSYGHDWARARGVPMAMGWMIDASENPFGDYPLDVLLHDGIKDQELDGAAHLDSTTIGFAREGLVMNLDGTGDYISDVFEFDFEWRAMVASKGGPSGFFVITYENGSQRENSVRKAHENQGYSQGISRIMEPGSHAFRVEDPENWSWAIAVAQADANYNIPAENDPIGFCPPGCPPLPDDFKGTPADIGEKK